MNGIRTPTPHTDRIWGRHHTRDRWHLLWIWHLNRQTQLNPNHPAYRSNDLQRYRDAADRYRTDEAYAAEWDRQVDLEETHTRHDLVAELNHFNQRAGAQTAHLGLTSHDIVDPTTQSQIHDSLHILLEKTATIAQALAVTAHTTRDLIIVERTHGQPAQASLYGLRIATVLSPLVDWHHRAQWYLTRGYKSRPTHGAVGTGADLHRVLTAGWSHNPAPGWDPLDNYDQASNTMAATRQTYHRVYDLHIAHLLVQLAAIAQTWSDDRRLEAMLGLGDERRDTEQTGSSAMPHKRNPVLAERVNSLCAIIRGHARIAEDLSSTEWLGGDVSGSAGRRVWLPGIFRATEAMLVNWLEASQRWEINEYACRDEVRTHREEILTGALMQWLIEHGRDRQEAHRMIAAGWRADGRATAPALTVEGLHLQHAQAVVAGAIDAVSHM